MIVEDDPTIAENLQELLENAGYKSKILINFLHALEEISEYSPDLILLDINIPYINGEILLKQIRETKETPVIMLTSKSSEIDEVLSMSYGADDYITKPYHPTILLLRIGAIFKRMENKSDTTQYKNIIIYKEKGLIKKGEKEIILTKNEMIILNYLLSNRNRIVTRDELMTTLWNSNEYINDNALTVNISRLRNKLETIGLKDAIETRKGIGYLLT